MRGTLRSFAAGLGCLGLCACAQVPPNEPLAQADPAYGYRIASTSRDSDVGAHLVEISFAQDPDPAEREYLSALPTGLTLTEADVQRVVAAAGRILSASPGLRAALADLAEQP